MIHQEGPILFIRSAEQTGARIAQAESRPSAYFLLGTKLFHYALLFAFIGEDKCLDIILVFTNCSRIKVFYEF